MRNALSKVALAALAAAGGAATTAGVAHAQSTSAPTHTTSWTGTVGEDRYGDARFKVRGRWQYDLNSSDWDTLAEDGVRSYTRRAFLGVQGRFSERWRYKIDFILSPGDDAAGQVGVDDAFLEYVADDWSIVLGESNITSPLEDRISSLDIPFVERSSVINAFEYGRRAGVGFIWGGANYSLSAALQGDSLNNSDTNFNADEATAISGRFTWAPIFETTPEGTTLVHLGLTARQRDIGGDAAFRYRTRPLNGRGTRWIDAGGGVNGESDLTWGAELAAQYGPFGVQAEYHTLEGDTVAGTSYEYDGYYVDLYWSLTGESRSYRGNQGSFGPIAPARPITTEGGFGHWMLSARYDFIDLSDPAGGLAGAGRGEQTAYNVGLDWIPIDHVRFKLNYASSEMDRTVGVDDEAQIVSLRSQFDF
jgi:phosphate-selective porin OprO/OprP